MRRILPAFVIAAFCLSRIAFPNDVHCPDAYARLRDGNVTAARKISNTKMGEVFSESEEVYISPGNSVTAVKVNDAIKERFAKRYEIFLRGEKKYGLDPRGFQLWLMKEYGVPHPPLDPHLIQEFKDKGLTFRNYSDYFFAKYTNSVKDDLSLRESIKSLKDPAYVKELFYSTARVANKLIIAGIKKTPSLAYGAVGGAIVLGLSQKVKDPITTASKKLSEQVEGWAKAEIYTQTEGLSYFR